MGMFSTEKAKQFAVLKEQKEALEGRAKIIGAMLEELGKEVFAGFADAGCKSYRLEGVGVFADGRDRLIYPEVKIHGAIADETQFFAHLRASGSAALIKETVNAATLVKWVKEQKAKNRPLPPEAILKVWNVETAKVNRAPSSADKKASAEAEANEGADTNE
jgi:hypothetical protein